MLDNIITKYYARGDRKMHYCTRCGRPIDPEDGYFYCDCYEDDDEEDEDDDY